MRIPALAAFTLVVALASPVASRAQTPWSAELTAGYAGFLDDATKHFVVLGGGVRRQVTPRVSIGPEVVVMFGEFRDRNVMLTGNVVFDVYPEQDGRRVTPFLVGGLGMYWHRELVRGGPYWSSDPAFTAGGGIRARISDAVSASIEYRVGWEPHQRITGSAGFHW